MKSFGFGKPLEEGSHLKFIAWWFNTVTAVLILETLIIHGQNIDENITLRLKNYLINYF